MVVWRFTLSAQAMILDLLAFIVCLALVARARASLAHRRELPAATQPTAAVSLIVPRQAGDPDPTDAIAPLVESGDVVEAFVVRPPGQPTVSAEVPAGGRAADAVAAPETAACASGRVRFLEANAADLTGPGLNQRSVLLAAGAREAAGEWVLFTEPAVEIRPGTVRRAIAFAVEREAPIAILFPAQRFAGWVDEVLLPPACQWTLDGVDADEIEPPAAKVAAGSPSFFLARRDAYDRIGGHAAVLAAPRDAVALVRNAKRAGLRVAAAPAGDCVVRAPRAARAALREVQDRFHASLPSGRVGAFLVTAVVLVAGVRPFWRAAEEIVPGGTGHGPAALAVALATCGLLLYHRLLFHRLMGIRLRGVVFHPLAALGLGCAAVIALAQRLLGRGPGFEKLPEERLPDHSGGVDYASVYTERYFDGVDSTFNPWGLRDDDRYYERILEPILARVRCGRALDVGCGLGYLTRRLASHFEVEGIDVSPAAVARCREALPDAAFTIHNVEEPFPQAEASFDLATMTDVFEHVVHPERLIDNAARVLKDGGFLAITTPNLNWIRRMLYAKGDRREHHVSLRSREEVVRLLEEKGFEVVESWTYMSAYLILRRFRSSIGPETGVVARKRAAGAGADP